MSINTDEYILTYEFVVQRNKPNKNVYFNVVARMEMRSIQKAVQPQAQNTIPCIVKKGLKNGGL